MSRPAVEVTGNWMMNSAMSDQAATTFLSFSEAGKCRPFLAVAKQQGFEAIHLEADSPRLRKAVREIAGHLTRTGATALCCHGYKANLLGRTKANGQTVEDTTIYGVTANIGDMKTEGPASGRYITDTDNQHRSLVALIGSDIVSFGSRIAISFTPLPPPST